jgi:hypothetical protein
MNSLACPYCNSFVAVPEQVGTDQRVPCPRCGASFPYRVQKANGITPSSPSDDQPQPFAANSSGLDTPYAAPPRRWSNRTIGAIVLGGMAVMAVLGLVFALNTQSERRSRDPVNPLGYLPSDTNVIASVHLTQLLKDPAGREFANQLTLGPTGLGLANIERLTGLKREDVNVAVLGLKMEAQQFPRVLLVVQTREPYDEAAVREALKTERQTERGQKTLHQFPGGIPLFKPAVWFASANILVICLNKPEDFDAVPLTPHAGVDHLAAPLQVLLHDQLGRGSQAWLIAHADKWDEMFFKPRLGLPGDREALAKVQTVGVWLRFDQTAFLNAACRCNAPDAAEALRQYLIRRQVVDEKNVEVQKDTWVIVQSPTSAEAVQRALKQSFALPFPISRQ